MLDLHRDVDSSSNTQRNTSEFIRQLKESGRPIVLTINGKAELVIEDRASFQRLLEIAERVEELESLRIAVEEMCAGKGISVEEMFEEFRQFLAEKRDR